MTVPRTFMVVAGEASGDLLAAELVSALRSQAASTSGVPLDQGLQRNPNEASALREIQFFGAGGSNMAAAGVELAFDLTEHAVIGLGFLPRLFKLRRLMRQLVELAMTRRPDTIVCVDFSGFNRRLGQAIRQRQAEVPGWRPRLVQFVSPQVWASRPGRAAQIARDFDLLLSIFPFEKAWYAKHTPVLRVEFVGHPMIDRYAGRLQILRADAANQMRPGNVKRAPGDVVLLLPGSREGELRRHLPLMVEAVRGIQKAMGDRHVSFRLVVPNNALERLAREWTVSLADLEIQVGHLAEALRSTTVALASTGTVTMECAFFGVPTVTLYKTNWLTFEIGRRVVTVKSLTMPNLLADQTIFPEFIQHGATPEALAGAALELLKSPERREQIRQKLATVIAQLGGPGACQRAATHIWNLTTSDDDRKIEDRKIFGSAEGP